jgi:hypothetical protein
MCTSLKNTWMVLQVAIEHARGALGRA